MSCLTKLLVPPGNGVFTVNTAKEKKQSLQQRLFNSIEPETINQTFYATLQSIKELADNQVGLLGICSDTGGGILRGANWGPMFIREALYQTEQAVDLIDFGDCKVIPHLLHDKYLNKETIKSCQNALYHQDSSLPVSPLSIAEKVCDELYGSVKNLRLLSLGGDHSVSYPLVKSFLAHKKQQGKKVGLIHFDAHTDLLRERLGIDLCFGSWLTHVLPYFESPLQVAQIGIRSTGKPKEHWQDTFGLKQYWAHEVENDGVQKISEKVIRQLTNEQIDELYISFDIDALDESIAASTGTPEPDGLSLQQALDLIEIFGSRFKLTGADLVEVAPMVGNDKESQETLRSANKIVSTLLTQFRNKKP
jgi:agmatinase